MSLGGLLCFEGYQRRRGSGGEGEGEATGRSGGRGDCGQDVMHARRKKKSVY